MDNNGLEFTLNLENSILFQQPDNTSKKEIGSKNDNDAKMSTTQANDVDKLFFNSISGVKIELKRKENIKDSIKQGLFENENSKIWKNDDTYGININELHDRIESNRHSEEKFNLVKEDKDVQHGKLQAKKGTSTLWVEKWKPRKFIELVGNEATNRRVLFWLRQWTPVVFKETLPINHKILNSKKGKDYNDTVQFEDPFHRPFKKILLIHGTPGIGKTSVAHIIAKQQGYTVNEINASDERSGTFVKEKIHNDLFSNTFENKPICLIADEIDGSIENGFIKVLLDILRNDKIATNYYLSNLEKINRRSKTDKEASQIRKKLKHLLMRPIICICNNLYSSSLEKLRPFCEIIPFKKPSEKAIIERLSYILEKESTNKHEGQIDVELLKTIIDSSQNDLRNCINNLQFFCLDRNTNRGTGNISKDFKSSWFKVVNEIFQKDSQISNKLQMKNLMKTLEVQGGMDKIISGCFSMYLQVKYTDNGLLKPSKISDWLYFNDAIDHSLYNSGISNGGELQRYNSAVALKFFDFFSDIGNKNDIRIKSHDFEVKQLIKGNNEIVKLLLSRIATNNPSLSTFVNKKSLIFDILPILDSLVSYDLSSMHNSITKNKIYDNLIETINSYQLLLNKSSIANILSTHNFSNVNENSKDNYLGSLDMNRQILALDPPINKIVLFDPKSALNVTNKRPYTLNLLLAKIEETKAKKRHRDMVMSQSSHLNEAKYKKQKQDVAVVSSAESTTSSTSTVDFFKSQYNLMTKKNEKELGRNSTSNELTNANVNSSGEQHIRIWVKYKEGFSNAVRKNVNWNNFWE
ncbi:hypothetical protein TPHA_0C04080 [Tetrapisispora phaffii CBS 4417]|uniref:AAA+ ATPase domain-containing protein n=1 Tax=Tetrapisispora phaffii (strain ATCC 24235 / CBS 4417 / NBRC 1672 / NRRL Y-8282 / UCD 70-5) TaxID=1071381 RepID=G8BQP6_TETPH|nr:hypothetical protein TPHA_0C04080 [Tetrapisispora phaffii CBS 4417]CCE62558.1 hypothetical protein TPHA_0C04080 [Tetrapisispora phaffii CBS 4417]